jgi:hypothetical protein
METLSEITMLVILIYFAVGSFYLPNVEGKDK